MSVVKGLLVVNSYLKNDKFEDLVNLFKKGASSIDDFELDVIDNATIPIIYNSSMALSYDFVIMWDKDLFLARYFEAKNVKVFNSSKAIEVCDDKRLTTEALAKNNLPIPKTIIAPMTYENIGFTQLSFIENISREIGFPVVVKEAFGSFGKQVYLARNNDELIDIVKSVDTTKLLFQEYIDFEYGKDLRLQVIGDKVVASIIRYNPNDFRANISNGGSFFKYEPSKQAMDLAINAAKATKACFAGVDLLFDKEGYRVCEVNSNAHFRNIFDATGVDVAKLILEYAIDNCMN